MACLGCLQVPVPGKRSKSNLNELPTERTKKIIEQNTLSAKVYCITINISTLMILKMKTMKSFLQTKLEDVKKIK
jgi:hypothetical protein